MKELELELLGGLRLTLGGGPLAGVRYAKAKALLCYLAVTRRAHTRAALSGLLWSELPDEDARANLRVMLAQLRRSVPDHLLVDREAVALNRESPYRLDVEDFLENLRGYEAEPHIARLQGAAELYRGDFLEGFYVQGAPLFEEWVAGQRERLKHLALGALHALATYYTEARDYTAATDYLTRLLTLDPWREEAHRDLMRLLALSGQPGAALAQFENCRRVLAEALGVEPGLETAALADQIRRGELEAQPPPSARHNLPRPLTPLLGREEKLEQLSEQLANPDRRLLTLLGPGGVGKTRLALELAWTLREGFADGVHFVPLAPVADPRLVAATVAHSLGLRETGGGSLDSRLRTFLGDKQLLLVLDNFEHVLAAAPTVAELLAGCPQLKVVVTSRTPLHLRGEREAVVPPLPVPELGGPPHQAAVRQPSWEPHATEVDPDGFAALLSYPSVTLFGQRA